MKELDRKLALENKLFCALHRCTITEKDLRKYRCTGRGCNGNYDEDGCAQLFRLAIPPNDYLHIPRGVK